MVSYLRWQTTILTIADFKPTGDSKAVQFMDYDRTNSFDAINNLYQSTLLAQVVADRQGKIWAETDACLRPTGSARGLTTVLGLTRQDWRASIDFTFRQDENLSYIELGGIAYLGAATGSKSFPYLAGAPGDAPGYFGGLERQTGLVLASQTQLNELVGLAWARRNAQYPEIIIPVAGDYRVIDIAPQQRLTLTLASSDTWRGVQWLAKPFIPAEVSYQHRPDQQALLMQITVREETDAPPGETLEIPVDPPYDNFKLPSWSIQFPPLIPLEPILPPVSPQPGIGDNLFFVRPTMIWRTRDFYSSASPTFTCMTSGTFEATEYFKQMELDPADPVNGAYLLSSVPDGSSTAGPRVYHTSDLTSETPTWTNILSGAQVAALAGTSSQKEGYSITITAAGVIFMPLRKAALGSVGTVLRYSGGGWTAHDMPSAGASDNNDASQRNVVLRGNGVWGWFSMDRRAYRTANGGESWEVVGTWSDPDDNAIGIIPPPGGGAGIISYCIGGGSAHHGAQIKINGNGRLDDLYGGQLDWTPVHGDHLWAEEIQVTSQGMNSFFMHPYDYNIYGLFQPSGYSTTVPYYFVRSSGIGASFFFYQEFSDRTYALAYHRGDNMKFAVWSDNIGIMGTEDGGETWVTKDGNLPAAYGVTKATFDAAYGPNFMAIAWVD
jgi:hypothetical protein